MEKHELLKCSYVWPTWNLGSKPKRWIVQNWIMIHLVRRRGEGFEICMSQNKNCVTIFRDTQAEKKIKEMRYWGSNWNVKLRGRQMYRDRCSLKERIVLVWFRFSIWKVRDVMRGVENGRCPLHKEEEVTTVIWKCEEKRQRGKEFFGCCVAVHKWRNNTGIEEM